MQSKPTANKQPESKPTANKQLDSNQPTNNQPTGQQQNPPHRFFKNPQLTVNLWGTRGSCAAPFPNRMTYGGNTSCVSVHWEEGIAIFDAGTGILALGQHLEEESPTPIHLFIGHLHLDHIAGLPLFPPLFNQKNQLHFYGPKEGKKTFRERLTVPLSPPYWPISVNDVPASVTWHEAKDKDTWELPGKVKVSAMKSNHPDGCLIYRLERDGLSVVYGLDCEFFTQEDEKQGSSQENKNQDSSQENKNQDSAQRNENQDSKQGNEKQEESTWEAYKNFARKCSLLIFDAPYTQNEYPAHRGFGHSYWEKGLQMAKEYQAEKLCICHHNWDRSDKELEQIEKELRSHAQKTGIQAEIAKEGQKIELFKQPNKEVQP